MGRLGVLKILMQPTINFENTRVIDFAGAVGTGLNTSGTGNACCRIAPDGIVHALIPAIESTEE